MKLPLPGSPVRGSQSGQPIMALFDLLGRNWAMGILWNLNDGALNFRQLQAKCETVSPGVLNTRLKELRQAFLITHNQGGYMLTDTGQSLFDLLYPLGQWSNQWASKFIKND
ncbi:MAG: helix-turn-helix transcriptional regulator [Roseivirga sp.]|nr:helix-turn-helix transcriptional regulator [Roseivirga sp.]